MTALLAAVLSLGTAGAASAEIRYFPGVTEEMCGAEYWAARSADADLQLLSASQISGLNRRMREDPACFMYDLENFKPEDFGVTAADTAATGETPNQYLARRAGQEIRESYVKDGYYHRSGEPVDEAFAERISAVLEQADPAAFQTVRYGIAVRRTDLRAYPTEEIITDEKGDIDFDYIQLSGVAVNEPVIIRGQTADGQWYYCCSDNCSGWIPAADTAICRSRSEWLSAWKIPADRVLVVTDSRFALEYSNTHPETSGLVLTMGTVLERADAGSPAGTGSGELIGNRSAYQNHVVYVPVRNGDGSYGKVKVLISERHKVREGYVPLTRRNILETAMNALGDAYGWGGMLSAEDCSSFLHGLYACFGLRLPRNTTWQSAAPLFRMDLNYLPDEQKLEVIRALPAGTMLYFRGHAMLYLGEKDGKAFVLSSVSSVMDPEGKGKLRVRSVVINSLDLLRANGNSWLTSLNTAVLPFLDPGEPGSGFRNFGGIIRFRRENGSFAALNWEQIGEDWYYFDRDGAMAVSRWIPARDEADTWYYVGSDGKMVRDTVIDGYAVDQDGAYRR